MKKIITILLLATITFGCKQKDIQPILETPVFVVEAKIGTENILLEAGNNNIYMYTDYSIANNGLYQLSGNLAPVTCDTCEPSISVIINANKQSGNNYNYNPDVFQANNTINSFSLDTTSNFVPRTVTCYPQNVNANTTYSWLRNGILVSTTKNVTIVLDSTIAYNITMVTNTNGVIDSITNTISGNNLSNFDTTSLSFSKTTKIFQYQYNGPGNMSIQLGDGTLSIGNAVAHLFSLPNLYYIQSVIKNGSDSIIYRYKLNADVTAQNNLYPSFGMKVKPAITAAKQNENTAILSIKKNGKTYVSYKNNATINQSNKPIITILNSAFGELNPQGKKTIVFDAKVNLYLYNMVNNADSILFSTQKMIMAVAIPN